MYNEIFQSTAMHREIIQADCAKENMLSHGQIHPYGFSNEIRTKLAGLIVNFASHMDAKTRVRRTYYYVPHKSSLRNS